MKTKTILSIAIISILPLTAHTAMVETNTPAAPDKSKDTYIAVDVPPYGIAEITNDDATHIASTAYVKGAYNDTIAGINRTYNDLNDVASHKQNSLYYIYNGHQQYFTDKVETDLSNVGEDGQLVTGMAVKNAIDGVSSELGNKRVEIYTTWDDDTAKQQVAFVTAQ